MPAILLRDQFLVDSFTNIPALDLQRRHQFVKTDTDYARYRIIANGLSPRGLPGYGDGPVCLDTKITSNMKTP